MLLFCALSLEIQLLNGLEGCLVCGSLSVLLNVTFRYLQEIGYTDTIIDVRSSRVRQLLGLQGQNEGDDNRQMVNGEGTGKRPSEGQGRR